MSRKGKVDLPSPEITCMQTEVLVGAMVVDEMLVQGAIISSYLWVEGHLCKILSINTSGAESSCKIKQKTGTNTNMRTCKIPGTKELISRILYSGTRIGLPRQYSFRVSHHYWVLEMIEGRTLLMFDKRLTPRLRKIMQETGRTVNA